MALDILQTPQGGLGTGTPPTVGQVPVGQSDGTYAPGTPAGGFPGGDQYDIQFNDGSGGFGGNSDFQYFSNPFSDAYFALGSGTMPNKALYAVVDSGDPNGASIYAETGLTFYGNDGGAFDGVFSFLYAPVLIGNSADNGSGDVFQLTGNADINGYLDMLNNNIRNVADPDFYGYATNRKYTDTQLVHTLNNMWGDVTIVPGTNTTVVNQTLPIGSLGTWIDRGNYIGTSQNAVRMSFDGRYVYVTAGGVGVLTSTDYGSTFISTLGGNGSTVATSRTGQNTIANVDGKLYRSTDFGTSWSDLSKDGYWQYMASDETGTNLVITDGTDIWTSNNSGSSWALAYTGSNIRSIAMSWSGQTILAGVNGGQMLLSLDAGDTWNNVATSQTWRGVTMTPDGTIMYATVDGGHIWKSSDSGSTWSDIYPHNSSWREIACSGDGQTVVVAHGNVFMSYDGGVTFTEETGTNQPWVSFTMSYLGNRIAGTLTAGDIYTSCNFAQITIDATTPSAPGLAAVLAVSNDGGFQGMFDVPYINDNFNNPDIDVQNRALYSSFFQSMMQWDNYNNTGVIFPQGIGASGDASFKVIDTEGQTLYDYSGVRSGDWNARLDYASDGATVNIDYSSTGGITIPTNRIMWASPNTFWTYTQQEPNTFYGLELYDWTHDTSVLLTPYIHSDGSYATPGDVLTTPDGYHWYAAPPTGGSSLITTTNIYLDSNRTDTYTEDGTIAKPFKTIGAAITAMNALLGSYGAYGFNIYAAAGYYNESGDITFPNTPIGLYGANVYYIADGGSGTITFQNAVASYDTGLVGNVVFANTSSSVVVSVSNPYVYGNVTVNGFASFINGIIQGNFTSSSTAICTIEDCIVQGTVTNAGQLILSDMFVQANSDSNYAVDSSSSGSNLTITDAKISNAGTGGGINVDNGATSTNPNSLMIVQVTINGTTNGIVCGTAYTHLNSYAIFPTSGVLFASGSNISATYGTFGSGGAFSLTYGATTDIDCTSTFSFDLLLTGDTTFNFIGTHAAGRMFTLLLQQDGYGGHGATWPSDVVWPNDIAPTLTSTPLHGDWIEFYDNGTKWLAVVLTENVAVATPDVPTGLAVAAVFSTEVDLTWDAMPGAASYNVYRDGTFITNVGTNSVNDTGLTINTMYSYTVSSVNGYGESAQCSPVTPTTLPGVPTSLAANVISSTEIDLTWDSMTGATSYNIYRDSGSGYSLLTNVGTNSYNDTGLTPSTTYYYKVTSVNGFGETLPCTPVSATTDAAASSGSALQFDGATNYVTVPGSLSFFNTAVTWEFWAKGQFDLEQGTASGSRWFIRGESSLISYLISDASSAESYINYSYTPDYSNWHHFAFTYDGSVMQMFIDGVSVGSQSGSPSGFKDVSSNPLVIGGQTGLFMASGSMDEVRISNSVRYSGTFTPEHSWPLSDATTVAYWNMNEGTGTVLNDISSNGNIGTLINSPTWVDGLPTYGLQFDNSSTYVDCGNAGGFGTITSSGFTAEAWVYWPGVQGNKDWAIMGNITGIGYTVFIQYFGGSDARLAYYGGSGGENFYDSVTFPVNTWTHVAVSIDSSFNVTVFKNGVSIATGTSAAKTGTGDFLIGKYRDTDNYGVFNGIIDEVRVSNTNRYTTNFTPQKSFALDADTQGYWKFEEGVSTTAFDSSGNANDGTLVNSPTWAPGVFYVYTPPVIASFALEFNGTNYATIPTSADFDLSVFTLECWVNYTSPGVYHILNNQSGGKGFNLYQSFINTHALAFDDGANTIFGSITVDDGNWHHVAIVSNGSTMTMYIDGVSDGSNTCRGIVGGTDITIGGIGTTLDYIGSVDGFRISDTQRYTGTFQPVTSFPKTDVNTMAYYPMDEGSGIYTNDTSGRFHNATLINTPAWVSGVQPYSLSFNGINQYVNITTPTSASPYTIETWVKTSTDGYIAEQWDGSNGFAFRIGSGVVVFYTPDIGNTVGSVNVANGEWNHIAVVEDGTNVSIYVNGVLDVSAASSYSFGSTADLTIGTSVGGASITGEIDEVRISSVARYTSSFAPQYTLPVDANTIGYWKFDEGTGSTAIDSSGNGNTGTLVNAPTYTDGVIFTENLALAFNGINQYVSVPGSSDFAMGADGAVELWIKTTTANQQIFVGGGFGTLSVGYAMYVNSSGAISYRLLPNSDVSGSIVITDGNWHHVALSLSSGNASLYIDGTIDTTSTSESFTANSSYNFDLGYYPAAGAYFTGSLDEIMFSSNDKYSTGFTPTTTQPITTNTVAYYKFNDDPTLTTTYDSTGLGHDGTLVNNPTRVSGV